MTKIFSNKKSDSNWIEVTLPDIIGNSGLFVDGDWIESKDQDPNGEVRLIQLADIGDGDFRNKSARFLTLKRAMEIKCTFLSEGDILLARMPDPLGRACIFPLKGERKYVTAVDVAIIRANNKKVNTKFLLYTINNPSYRRMIEDLESGTTRKRISRKNLSTIPFSLPSTSTQNQIVSKIEELFSELDKGIENLKLAQQQLKVYRQSVLKWAFEGLPFLPFDKIIESSQNGLSKRSGTKGEPYKVLRLADIDNNTIAVSNPRKIVMDLTEIKKYKIKTEDLLCIRVNGSKDLVGKLVYVSIKNENENWAFCDHFIRFRLDSEKVSAKFYHYYFTTVAARKYIQDNMVTSAGQNTVSQGTIKNMMVPSSDIKAQKLIIEDLENRFSVCDKMEETINQCLQQSEAMRQSILKRAIEGSLLPEKS